MYNETGNLSINSENILPIIKKWLYSDVDIFMRELVSNAADAITKLKRLSMMGEADLPEDEQFSIKIVLDKEAKTIKFIDNGLGMTAEEIKEYINQIAFSGATAFLEKYKDKADAENGIIGHFGLGFYSAFMVAGVVEIDSLSYKTDAQPAKWRCEGGIEFSLTDGTKAERGTEITLFVSDENTEFLDDYKLRQIIRKYCSFIPVDIYYENAALVKNAVEEEVVDGVVLDKPADDTVKDAPTPINNKSPLWLRKPSECTDDDYKQFYREVFMDFNEPLFWMHLNMDFPFRLKGILYFPKLKHELESIEGQVKLYNNQVFIADNIKEVIPEFLLLLKGVIDCPDLPLNVSRSFLQNDGFVTKMSEYIIRKVADKLTTLFKNERETYNKNWDDIAPFVKYGCLREKDFYDKAKPALLYKLTDGTHVTLEEYLAANEPKIGKSVIYVSNEQQQAQYIKLLNDQGISATLLTTRLDAPFINFIESQEKDTKFTRIDSDLSDALVDSTESDDAIKESLEGIFKQTLGNDALKVDVKSLKSDGVPAIIVLSEEARRMKDMMAMYSGMGFPPGGDGSDGETLVLNSANPLIKRLIETKDDAAKADDATLICEQVYDLAMMSHKPLSTEAMNAFVERSAKILNRLI